MFVQTFRIPPAPALIIVVLGDDSRFSIDRTCAYAGKSATALERAVQMIRRFISCMFALAIFTSVVCCVSRVPAANLAEVFQNPPESARPWVFWYWLNGAVSREGITADLEAMKRVGIGGAYLMPISDVTDPPLFDPPARQLSPEWWTMVRHAFTEADRLGLKLAMHACDGFATAGGPWITPELAMQKVVWSQTQVEGGKPIELVLARPQANEGFYRDIAVLAFPTPEGEGVTTRTVVPKVTCSVSNATVQQLVVPGNTQRFRSEEPCWIQYEFAEPFTCRSITVSPDGANYQALRLIVEASDDGKTFRSLGRLETPRHGWQDRDADYTFAIPATTARFFRFVHDPAGSEPGAEDLDSAKWRAILKVQRIELSSAARIPNYEGKSGAVWRKSSRADAGLIPDSVCVPLDKITNLTSRLDAGRLGRSGSSGEGGHRRSTESSRLRWDAPPGLWTILRVGYTPTGHQNETGGGGRGLECDKFNPVAARVQFDGWFGEAIRQVGPELAGRVLKIFHVDSWEAGSQNWSAVFREEFQRRRGYDPTPYLPTFAGIPVGSADVSERFLFDVRQTISDLTTENFFGTMARLAHRHGCEFSAEATAPTMMGDGMRHFGGVDVPMGEFWLRSPTHDKPNDIHDAISGARIYGKPIVQAEAFTELRLQWDEHPAMLKALGDHNFALGINRFIFHVFMQNPWTNRRPGITLGGVGTFFQRDQTWWDMAGAWIDYTRRCQALLQIGRPVADVVYFTGEELPGRAVLPERRSPALPASCKADSINRDALLRLASVRPGNAVLGHVRAGRIELPGGASYAVLVLPDTPLMTPEVVAKIQELVRAGAIVYGPPPERSLSLEGGFASDKKVRQIAEEVWGKGDRKSGWDQIFGHGRVIWGQPLKSVLEQAGVTPDFTAETEDDRPAVGIEWTHRSSSEGDIYFVSNQRNTPQTVRLTLRSRGQPELWEPVTGEMTVAIPVAIVTENVPTEFFLQLPPQGSMFVALRKPEAAKPPARGGAWIEPRTVLNIAGTWGVAFDPAMSGHDKPVSFPELASWTQHDTPALRHYSGTAVYAMTFDWNEPAANRVWLDLGRVADIASVTLNGKDCGVAWTPPFRVEVTDAIRRGTNVLEIRVANTWHNRLVGDRSLPPAERKTWTNGPERSADAPLLPAGLFGPVTLQILN
jgi:hypothetical protein